MSGEKKPKKPRQSKGDGDLYFKMQINIPPSGLNPGSVCKITAPNGDIHFVTIPMDVEVGTSFIRALPKVFNEVTLGSLDTQELRQWHFHRKIELPSVTEDATDSEEKQVLLDSAIKWLAESHVRVTAVAAAMKPAGWECEVDGTWLAYPGAFLHAPSSSEGKPAVNLVGTALPRVRFAH